MSWIKIRKSPLSNEAMLNTDFVVSVVIYPVTTTESQVRAYPKEGEFVVLYYGPESECQAFLEHFTHEISRGGKVVFTPPAVES